MSDLQSMIFTFWKYKFIAISFTCKNPVKAFATSFARNNAILGTIISEVKSSELIKLTDFLQNEKNSANKQSGIINSSAFWVASNG